MKDPKPRNPHGQLSAATLRGLGKLLEEPILNAPVFDPGENALELAWVEITPKNVAPLEGEDRQTFFLERLKDRAGICSRCHRQGVVLAHKISLESLYVQMVDGSSVLFCVKCAPKGLTRHIHMAAR